MDLNKLIKQNKRDFPIQLLITNTSKAKQQAQYNSKIIRQFEIADGMYVEMDIDRNTFKKTDKERAMLESLKHDWKNGCRKKFGKNWTAKKSSNISPQGNRQMNFMVLKVQD